MELWNQRDDKVSDELLVLTQCPIKRIMSYDGYVVNGYRFHTKARLSTLAHKIVVLW